MADRIVFDYTKMDEAFKAINTLAGKYEKASQTFQTEMAKAISTWEGESKDAFEKFIKGAIKTHMETDIPNLVRGIATLLQNNATAMGDADSKIAQNMPKSL